jgi:hypothetical protein
MRNLVRVMTVDEFFDGQDLSRQIYNSLFSMVSAIGTADIRITKSQISFCRQKAFAWIWMPGKYLHGKIAPLVLTLVFHSRDESPRWKEIVEPSPGHFTHHLELFSINEVDDQVRNWLWEAWKNAG